MLFFSKNKADQQTDNKAPQQRTKMRSALRFAFNPEFGAAVRPIGEVNSVFINLLAMIFIAQKMFPADHPAYLAGTLTLRELLFTLWRNLKFTKQNTPQIILFFALIAGLIFTALAALTLVMSILSAAFVTRAHAASGYFTSPAGDDIAQGWIDFLRSGNVTGSFFSSFAQPLMWAGGIQGAMISALGFYSDAILIVAAVILFYHLASMVVETAHEGVVMGKKANQIWAPIRLVVAIGLLVPIGGGLNSGQYIVFKMTEWGSGLASNVWDIFLGGFASGTGVAGVPEFAADVVFNAIAKNSCEDALGHAEELSGGPNGDPDSSNPNAECKGNGAILSKDSCQKNFNSKNARMCGHSAVVQGKGQSPTAQAVNSSASSCMDQLDVRAKKFAQEANPHFAPQDQKGDGQRPPKYKGEASQMIADYMQCLAEGLPIPTLTGVFALSAEWGWMSAGAVLSAISQAESDAFDLGNLIPDVQPPDCHEDPDPNGKEACKRVGQVNSWISSVAEGGGGDAGGAIGSDFCMAQRGELLQEAQAMRDAGPAQGHFLDRVFQVIDWLARWNCVYVDVPPPFSLSPSGFSIGMMFMGVNPLAQMAALGQAMINTAYDAFDIMVNLSASSKKIADEKANNGSKLGGSIGGMLNVDADGAQGAVSFIGGILGIICSMFFTSGVLLAYYVPLIPFIAFLFSVLSWVLAVLEAVIAIPLLALAHLTVQGEGLPGAAARAGYFFIFNIALKPVLMVFGLIVGLIVFMAAVSYMNLFYMMAISTSGGLATSHLFLSRLIYNALYVVILYICANASFKAIHSIPEHAMKWMGSSPYHFERMGDPKEVAGPLLSGAGQISQVTGALQSGGWGAAKSLQGGGLANAVTSGAQATALPKPPANKGGA